LIDKLQHFYCDCEHAAEIFSGLLTYFEHLPYLSFLTFQPIFLLVGLLGSFPTFSVYFEAPGSMLLLHQDILSCDFILSSLRLVEDMEVNPDYVKVARLLYTNRGSIIHVSLAAAAVLNDPNMATGSFGLVFGFIKERPVDFMRYAMDLFFNAARNAPQAIEAPKVVGETFTILVESASGT
jgi:hypothetical protein